MNLKIQNRNLEISPTLQRVIERKAQKIRRILPTFSADSLELHVTLERLPRGHQYRTVLVLTTPQTAIRVEETEDNSSSSVLRAYDELTRKIKKFKSQLTHERFWQRQPAWARTGRAESPRDLDHLVSQHLDKIHNYIRRELFHQVMAENLPAGLLQTEALVDEVFIQLRADAETRPEHLSFEQWMFQVARDQVRKRIRALDRESVHLEEPLISPAARWDDEALNFYQPDEVLRLEDLLRDRNTNNPEELMAREEEEEALQRAIAHLPDSVRESFVLSALEGFDPDEVAMITGKAPAQVEKDIESARRQLRHKLQS